jgi:hypothetical protein
MKFLVLILFIGQCSIGLQGNAQNKKNNKKKVAHILSFPNDWYGHWKGKLSWQKANTDTPIIFTMNLIIKPTEQPNVVSWQIQYGDSLKDVRPYTCSLVDSAKKHWLIDEHNGILIDQFVIGNNAFSSFTVQGTCINNNYQLQPNGGMRVEFISSNTKPVRISGENTAEVPTVESFIIKSFQVGTLYKIKQD